MQYAFVDTENIGRKYENLLENLKPKSKVILFYTEANKNAGIPYELFGDFLNKEYEITTISTGNGTHDALDFCLSSQLGYSICKLRNMHFPREFIIYSNDQGYNAIAEYWQKKGFDVKCLSTNKTKINSPKASVKAIIKENEPNAEKAVKKSDNKSVNKTSAKTTKTATKISPPPEPDELFGKYARSDEEYYDIFYNMISSNSVKGDMASSMTEILIKAIKLKPNKQLSYIFNRMITVHGKEKGTAVYKAQKKIIKKLLTEYTP